MGACLAVAHSRFSRRIKIHKWYVRIHTRVSSQSFNLGIHTYVDRIGSTYSYYSYFVDKAARIFFCIPAAYGTRNEQRWMIYDRPFFSGLRLCTAAVVLVPFINIEYSG